MVHTRGARLLAALPPAGQRPESQCHLLLVRLPPGLQGPGGSLSPPVGAGARGLGTVLAAGIRLQVGLRELAAGQGRAGLSGGLQETQGLRRLRKDGCQASDEDQTH
jgi:hypothetical protein